jgi:rhodanese-related sulfurtransferase
MCDRHLCGFVNTILRFLLLSLAGILCALSDALLTGLPDLSQPIDEWGIRYEDVPDLSPVIWVDGRSNEDYEESHHEGAIHLNFEFWDEGIGLILEKWEPGTGIVVYCEGRGCESSRAIAERLRNELEMDSIYWLTGGWNSLVEGMEAQ